MSHKCHARRYLDQMICVPCGLIWDVNDPEPPKCKTRSKLKVDPAPIILPSTTSIPAELSKELAGDMAKVYKANGDGVKGMQAAYRLFLDRTEL